MSRLLDGEIIFQGQGNFDPSLWDTPILILIFVLFVVGAVLDGVLRVIVELLDVIERSELMSIERLSGHGPDAIDARKLPQNFVLFVFEKGFCGVFNDDRTKPRFEKLTGFRDFTALEVLPNLLWL